MLRLPGESLAGKAEALASLESLLHRTFSSEAPNFKDGDRSNQDTYGSKDRPKPTQADYKDNIHEYEPIDAVTKPSSNIPVHLQG